MGNFKIEVKELGSNNVEKSVEVEKIDYDTLYGVVKPHLYSSAIGFRNIIEGEWGIVVVGLFRTVGKIRFTNIMESNLKVYFDGDSTWYATPWDKEKTIDWLIEKLYLDEDIAECLKECDLDDGCMWYETNDPKDVEELGDYDEVGNGGIGDLRKGIEDKNTVEKLMSFREVIELQGDSENPYIIASTDY